MIIASTIMPHAYIHVCVYHTTGLLALAEGPDDRRSVEVVRLSRNSNTIRSFIGLHHRVSAAADRIVGLSLMTGRGLKTQRWLGIWNCFTYMENASVCNDQPKGRWACRSSSAIIQRPPPKKVKVGRIGVVAGYFLHKSVVWCNYQKL